MTMTDVTPEVTVVVSDNVTPADIEALNELLSDMEKIEKKIAKQAKKEKTLQAMLKKAKNKAKKGKGKKKGLMKRFWAALKRKIKSAVTWTAKFFKKIAGGIKKAAKKIASLTKAAAKRVSTYLAGKGIIPRAYRAIKSAVIWVGTPLVIAAKWVYAGIAYVLSGVSLAVAAVVLAAVAAVIFVVTLPFRGSKDKKSKKSKKSKAKKTAKDTKPVMDADEKTAREMVGDEKYEQIVSEAVKKAMAPEVPETPAAQHGKGHPTPKRQQQNRRHHGPRDHTPPQNGTTPADSDLHPQF